VPNGKNELTSIMPRNALYPDVRLGEKLIDFVEKIVA
jgi:hypothetical protein